jgi:glycosyltransferase involved in cell wall biosynthesis
LEFLTYAGIGGTQRMVVEFLRRVSRKKFRCYVCVLLEEGFVNEQATAMHIENVSLKMRGYWDLVAWWKFYTFIKGKQLDLIRTYGLKAHIIGRIVGKLLGVPVQITSVRSTDPWRKWYHTLLDRMTSGFADLYLSNSEAGRLITHQRERIPLSKIRMIPNGIDLANYAPATSATQPRYVALKKELGIAYEDRVIGIVANFRAMKGHRTIVDALPRIRANIPHIKCLFVGEAFVNEPSYQQELQHYVQEQRLADVIIFTGRWDDIPDLLAILDVLLLPSLWEGLPTSVLEAMAMKKPIVASAVGGIPELVESGRTGILIPPQDAQALSDAVILLLSQPELAQKMGEAGYGRVCQDFSLSTITLQTETLYEQLIQKKRGLTRRRDKSGFMDEFRK